MLHEEGFSSCLLPFGFCLWQGTGHYICRWKVQREFDFTLIILHLWPREIRKKRENLQVCNIHVFQLGIYIFFLLLLGLRLTTAKTNYQLPITSSWETSFHINEQQEISQRCYTSWKTSFSIKWTTLRWSQRCYRMKRIIFWWG